MKTALVLCFLAVSANAFSFGTFLDASMHLCMRICPSVSPSVCWSVGLSVLQKLQKYYKTLQNSANRYKTFWKTVREAMAVCRSFLDGVVIFF